MRTIVWCFNALFLINYKNFRDVDGIGVVDLDMTFNEFAVLHLRVMKSMFIYN